MPIDRQQFRASDPRRFGLVTKDASAAGSPTRGVPDSFRDGGMQIGAAFSPLVVVPFGFSAIKRVVNPDTELLAIQQTQTAYYCLARVEAQDVGGPFTWQGFSLHLKSTASSGDAMSGTAANRDTNRPALTWGDGRGEQAGIILGTAKDLVGLENAQRGTWTFAAPVVPFLNYAAGDTDLAYNLGPKPMIAQAFPVGDYNDPTKTREFVTSERENPLSVRVGQDDALLAFLAVPGSVAASEDDNLYFHGFAYGRLILAGQQARQTL